jgi:hypothetical protein
VQSVVVEYLLEIGYLVQSFADTATKQRGKDIVAKTTSGRTLWVSAKGYPAGTVNTNARTQARHWFAQALFDLILWHGEDSAAALALALPQYEIYRRLSDRVRWFLSDIGCCIFWVSEDGSIREDSY